jgi:polyisoprenoid-binding protein YceI
MGTRYRLDPAHSRFTVQAFGGGMLSFLAHSPTFAVRDFAGAVDFEGDAVAGMRVEMTVRAGALQLVDNVKPADRTEIEGRMRGEVLEITTYPEVRLELTVSASERVEPGRYRLRLGGSLALRGVSHPHRADADLRIFDDGVRLRGESSLRLSEYHIKPVTALGGAIRLKDDLKVSFDLAALPEAP